MLYNIPTRSNPMPFYVDNSIDPDLIWFMDFSNGFTEPFTNVTGTNNATSFFQIQTDSTMGTYLQCTKATNGQTNRVYWSGSKNYLNQFFETYSPFSLCFWMKAPQWGSGECIISWRYSDSSTGLVAYADGGDTSKIDARISMQNNFMTATNAQNSDWVHWVVVRDSSSARWYRNGVLDNTTTSFSYTPSIVASEDIQLGNSYQWSCHLIADLTKIRIYKKALTADQITALYNKKA